MKFFLISLASLGMISQVVALPRAGMLSLRMCEPDFVSFFADEHLGATSFAPVGEALKRSEDSVDGTQIAEGWKRNEESVDGTQIAEGW